MHATMQNRRPARGRIAFMDCMRRGCPDPAKLVLVLVVWPNVVSIGQRERVLTGLALCPSCAATTRTRDIAPLIRQVAGSMDAAQWGTVEADRCELDWMPVEHPHALRLLMAEGAFRPKPADRPRVS